MSEQTQPRITNSDEILLGLTRHLMEEIDIGGRAIDLLWAIKAICDEPLDERQGHGPTREDQFAKIDGLLRGLPQLPGTPLTDAQLDRSARAHLRAFGVTICR